ncbi:hypothetical protein [Noviherbaspirillum autotrophicum]|nr:hypothetical protein [Noviherbaspirillum autotrophicum]
MRIGTLYEYRNTEIHGEVIGDNTEGYKTRFMELNGAHVWTSETQPEFSRGFLKIAPGTKLTVRGNGTLTEPHESVNYYLFCATKVFNKEAMDEFKYDACIVIEHPEKFFRAISRTIRHQAAFEGIFNCQYIGRRISHDVDPGIPPAIIKDPTYKNQQEVRGLWKPLKANPSPMIINCPDAARYCSMYKRR